MVSPVDPEILAEIDAVDRHVRDGRNAAGPAERLAAYATIRAAKIIAEALRSDPVPVVPPGSLPIYPYPGSASDISGRPPVPTAIG